METLQETVLAGGTKVVCFGERAAHSLNSSLADFEEPSTVDQVPYEPLHHLWCDTNGVVIFAHHYTEADICL